MDPLKFRDLLATQVSWAPLWHGSFHMQGYVLHKVDAERLEFRSNGAYWLLLIPLSFNVASGAGWGWGLVIMGVSVAFVAVLQHYRVAPLVFDRRQGRYWRTRKTPQHDTPSSDRGCRLDEIHAVQLVREQVELPFDKQSKKRPSYELNLVLRDGRRLQVLDRLDRDSVQGDGAELARFLGCPLWDASEVDGGPADNAPDGWGCLFLAIAVGVVVVAAGMLLY